MYSDRLWLQPFSVGLPLLPLARTIQYFTGDELRGTHPFEGPSPVARERDRVRLDQLEDDLGGSFHASMRRPTSTTL